MNVHDLRKKHQRFIYESFSYKYEEKKLFINFQFLLDPNIKFSPEIVIPANFPVRKESVENFIFHLGLIEMISYWKAACPQELLILAGQISDEQIQWLHDLFIHGLGEFFYKNKIHDFCSNNFLEITCRANHNIASFQSAKKNDGDLILVAGGKDSTVTLEVLKNSKSRKGTFALNPTRAAIDSVRIAGYPEPLVAKRTIDPTLLEMNRQGYLNGHTPFSAYLAFLGVFIASLNGFENVIASNEGSANEQNVIFNELAVNHQYSKTFRFESLFRDYCEKYLTPEIKYFSFLRPLYDLQISKIFANYTQQHLSFRSCNVNQKKDSWCGACPKCAFVYTTIFPFLEYEQALKIFGEDLYENVKIQNFIRDLVGLGEHKPFECVGTEEETKIALILSLNKSMKEGRHFPDPLKRIVNEINTNSASFHSLVQSFFTQWNERNFLPENHATLLEQTLSSSVR